MRKRCSRCLVSRIVALSFTLGLIHCQASSTRSQMVKTTVTYRVVDGHRILHGVSHLLKPITNGEHGFGGGDPQEIEEAYKTMRKFIVKHLSAE